MSENEAEYYFNIMRFIIDFSERFGLVDFFVESIVRIENKTFVIKTNNSTELGNYLSACLIWYDFKIHNEDNSIYIVMK